MTEAVQDSLATIAKAKFFDGLQNVASVYERDLLLVGGNSVDVFSELVSSMLSMAALLIIENTTDSEDLWAQICAEIFATTQKVAAEIATAQRDNAPLN